MDTRILGTKGQIVCRPTTWIDVLKFFFFNYGLHVLTVVSPPGSKVVPTLIWSLLALLFPFSGTMRALDVIQQFARGESGDLQIAHRAGALCMLVPRRGLPRSAKRVYRKYTEVNGQHPVLPEPSLSWSSFHSTLDDEILDPTIEITLDTEYSLIAVPKSFTVSSLSDESFTPLKLSNNYSLVKAIVAIIQVVYAITELYNSSLHQLPKFGYAAYSLTVIPYMIMSLVNLVAAGCEPQYPAMFLVRYGGSFTTQEEMSSGAGAVQGSETAPEQANVSDRSEELVRGTVGVAYGILGGDLTANGQFDFIGEGAIPRLIHRIGVTLIPAVPYLAIYLLTSFKGRESTGPQRGFTMAWLVMGQYFGVFIYSFGRKRMLLSVWIYIGAGLLFSVGAVGGFVVVGQMIMRDEKCTII